MPRFKYVFIKKKLAGKDLSRLQDCKGLDSRGVYPVNMTNNKKGVIHVRELSGR
jgi:hypothetical protein